MCSIVLTPCDTDAYTSEELKGCLLSCLMEFSGSQYVLVGMRDQAMLLLSATTVFYGESIRMLKWSDLFLSEIPMDDVHLGYKVPVSCPTLPTCRD